MDFDTDNPKGSLLAREDVRAFVRIVAHYANANREFDGAKFGDEIPQEVLQQLRVINHGAAAAAFGALLNHCVGITFAWYQECRTPELEELAKNLLAMGNEESRMAHFAWFGIADFATPVNPQEKAL